MLGLIGPERVGWVVVGKISGLILISCSEPLIRDNHCVELGSELKK
jgi:hypothetical protein